MDVTRTLLLSLSLFLFTPAALAADTSKCFAQTSLQEHRIDKEDAIRYCFNQYKDSLTKQTCNQLVAKHVEPLASTRLSEEIKSLCFYETNLDKDMSSCMNSTKIFKDSSNRDEAVFYCYQQFQDKLSKDQCLKTANQLIYPAKKEYLKQHCLESGN